MTGQRLREVAGVTWNELDLAKGVWTLPGSRAKNGHTTLVPLTDGVRAIIADLPKIKSSAGLVFTTTGTTPVSGFSKVKSRLDAIIADLSKQEAIGGRGVAPMTPWRIQDLRRTLATGCQRLGVKLEVTESILNHVSGTRSGIVGVYQTYKYEVEKRDALTSWERHVRAVVNPATETSNILKLASTY